MSSRSLKSLDILPLGENVLPLSADTSSSETPTLSSSPTDSFSIQDTFPRRSHLRRSSDLNKAYSIRSSTSSRTYVPSVSLSRSDSSVSQYKFNSTTALDDSADTPSRMELNAALGADMIPHTTEITTLPCAGVRIAHGRLSGLMAWRFVVQLPEAGRSTLSRPIYIPHRPAIVTNFILDTGSLRSLVPAETLHALGYTGNTHTGAEVKLLVQGVYLGCKVAPPGEAGRLSAQFMMAASLALYYDERLTAPVLYFARNDTGIPRVHEIPSTVPAPPALSLKQLIMNLMNLGRRSSN